MIYGYARISSDGQSVAAQVASLTAAGADKVFRDMASGAKGDWTQLVHSINQLAPGDLLLVTQLGCVAHSILDLLNVLTMLAAREAGFRSLGNAWADTTAPHGRVILTILGGLAAFERNLVRVRAGEGRERAKARGVKMGRTPKLTPLQQREAIQRRENGEGVREIARSFNVSHSTISRL